MLINLFDVLGKLLHAPRKPSVKEREKPYTFHVPYNVALKQERAGLEGVTDLKGSKAFRG